MDFSISEEAAASNLFADSDTVDSMNVWVLESEAAVRFQVEIIRREKLRPNLSYIHLIQGNLNGSIYL